VAALVAAGLSATTAATVAVAVPATASSSAPSSSAPTASINVWWVTNPPFDTKVWPPIIKAFEKANPGDKVNLTMWPSNNTYKGKLTLALGSSNPPALFFSWGGGPLQTYINAGVVQPFADAGVSDAGSPSWKGNFLASTLSAVTFGGKLYGMPILGTQPVFLFYNKAVFAKAHLSFPTTWAELLSDIKTFNSDGIIPITLGNVDQWEGLMYLEYLADRYGGPQAFLNIENNVKGAWSQPAIQHALASIQTLVKDNAFETGYDAITYTTGATRALVEVGRAAMELMGAWDIASFYSEQPSMFTNGTLGIGAFPSVPGGKGNPADLEGNLTSYSALAAHLSPAQTYVAEKFMQYFASGAYAKTEDSYGQVGIITGTSKDLSVPPLGKYLVPVYNDVLHAPYFQYSWDQALGPTKASPMLNNLFKIFQLTETPAQFATAMNAYQTGS
jgi:raffinose/stachyose/melibiose transport system substrate-binding protein